MRSLTAGEEMEGVVYLGQRRNPNSPEHNTDTTTVAIDSGGWGSNPATMGKRQQLTVVAQRQRGVLVGFRDHQRRTRWYSSSPRARD